ncbi:conserved hypothetical protein [Ricinus communis]|uniref:Uncharacterized protein n=1 Tax=Ricinus communis TaxID=3988 RepID=B9RHF6_RICCO|nr:conserved hypothetical protein [Ricinus communis]
MVIDICMVFVNRSTSKSSVDNDDNAEAAEGVVMIRVLDASAQNSAVDNLRK